jgi:hypothetical protein
LVGLVLANFIADAFGEIINCSGDSYNLFMGMNANFKFFPKKTPPNKKYYKTTKTKV